MQSQLPTYFTGMEDRVLSFEKTYVSLLSMDFFLKIGSFVIEKVDIERFNSEKKLNLLSCLILRNKKHYQCEQN